jgi:hypothetical protein
MSAASVGQAQAAWSAPRAPEAAAWSATAAGWEPGPDLPGILHGLFAGPSNPFTLAVTPGRITNSVPGQRCVYLVTLDEGAQPGAAPVTLSLWTEHGSASVVPPSLTAGTVAEVTLVPDPGTQNGTLDMRIRGVRGPDTYSVPAALDVLDFGGPELDSERGSEAAALRDLFTPWLAEQHPELGIDADTTWRGTIVTPQILVVMHYLFFSEEWEMHVAWHIMIPPYDWVRIDLRRRYVETVPSRAFEISSCSSGVQPVEIPPPDSMWR